MRRGASTAFGLALVLSITLGASVSHAASIGFNDGFGPVQVPTPASPLATLSQFDPGLGTLTKVTLTLDADASGGTIAWDNEALFATDATLGIGANPGGSES